MGEAKKTAPDHDAAIRHLAEALAELLSAIDSAARADRVRGPGGGWSSMYSASSQAGEHLDEALKALGQERGWQGAPLHEG